MQSLTTSSTPVDKLCIAFTSCTNFYCPISKTCQIKEWVYHNFTTDSFAAILAEARKYRLCLTLSHQYMDQLTNEVRTAILGNVGSIISFRVGSTDAEILEKEFGNAFRSTQFMDLNNYDTYMKILDGGVHGEPFLATTYPPSGTRYGKKENMIRRSRERYAMPRAVIEDKIERWSKNGMK
ncbi:MAG: hypothetical protein PHS53_00340 [Candidatus Pacebacteria bacterium]|nr:hypothetical protein [Candidatus Paceibacterota bacterium]